MCGIVGIGSLSGISNWIDKEKWFTKALYVDTLRGFHSTGVFFVPYDGLNEDPYIYKKAMPGYDFLELSTTKDIINDIDKYVFMVGHNRKATQGNISSINAHPFQYEHITLVHNGTLDSRNGVAGSKVVEVDSEAICQAIAEKGAEVILPKLDGAYALVWYDASDCTLNMARNDERPLHFAFSDDGQNLFFASEAWMIKDIMPASFKVKTIFKLKKGIHVKFDSMTTDLRNYETEKFTILPKSNYNYTGYWMGGKWHEYETNTASTRDKIKAENLRQFGYELGQDITFQCTSFSPYPNNKARGNMEGITQVHEGTVKDEVLAYNIEASIATASINSNTLYTGKAVNCYISSTTNKVRITVEDVKVIVTLPEPEDVNLEEHLVLGPGGAEITEAEFEELTKHGCCWCTGNVHIEDSEDIEWTPLRQPICYDCQEAAISGEK